MFTSYCIHVLSFLTHLLGDMNILKCFYFCLSILYMDYSIQRRYTINYFRHYSIQKIFEFKNRDTWNHSQFLFNNFSKNIINIQTIWSSSSHYWLYVDRTFLLFFFIFMSDLKNKKSEITKPNTEKHRNKYRKQHTL